MTTPSLASFGLQGLNHGSMHGQANSGLPRSSHDSNKLSRLVSTNSDSDGSSMLNLLQAARVLQDHETETISSKAVGNANTPSASLVHSLTPHPGMLFQNGLASMGSMQDLNSLANMGSLASLGGLAGMSSIMGMGMPSLFQQQWAQAANTASSNAAPAFPSLQSVSTGIPSGPAGGNKTLTSAQPAQAEKEPVETKPQPARKKIKREASPRSVKLESGITNEEATKKAMRLEKNKMAARECRRKKKKQMEQLQNEKSALERKVQTLEEELAAKDKEIIELKAVLTRSNIATGVAQQSVSSANFGAKPTASSANFGAKPTASSANFGAAPGISSMPPTGGANVSMPTFNFGVNPSDAFAAYQAQIMMNGGASSKPPVPGTFDMLAASKASAMADTLRKLTSLSSASQQQQGGNKQINAGAPLSLPLQFANSLMSVSNARTSNWVAAQRSTGQSASRIDVEALRMSVAGKAETTEDENKASSVETVSVPTDIDLNDIGDTGSQKSSP
eukprot:TRINITY_DN12663_c1_g1_i1.p1 TRINITY_DN12663_c1_g1~~TRINITY_DN12663_c1_g1_i1.p1  ORF type:complete len:506 (+),score=118.69 TRINITY_DN12663_c1_g1_i1:70-1587(+)